MFVHFDLFRWILVTLYGHRINEFSLRNTSSLELVKLFYWVGWLGHDVLGPRVTMYP